MRVTRRTFLAASACAVVQACGGGRSFNASVTWGGPGLRDGQFQKPRAITARDGEVYVADTTGRIQVFDMDGRFLRKWAMPEYENGTPTSIAFANDGHVLVPDTHYSRIFKFTRSGEILEKWGRYGTGPDEFIYPTDIVQTEDGTYFISEYGMDADRVHVFGPDKVFLRQWGGMGEAPGKFNRAMAIEMDGQHTLLCADTANQRIQRFDLDGKLVGVIGGAGTEPGKLKFPYDVSIAPDGSVFACEYGTHRVSRFRADGAFVRCVGGPGREPGQMDGPRGVAVSPEGHVFVADTGNHRIQRFSIEDWA